MCVHYNVHNAIVFTALWINKYITFVNIIQYVAAVLWKISFVTHPKSSPFWPDQIYDLLPQGSLLDVRTRDNMCYSVC